MEAGGEKKKLQDWSLGGKLGGEQLQRTGVFWAGEGDDNVKQRGFRGVNATGRERREKTVPFRGRGEKGS